MSACVAFFDKNLLLRGLRIRKGVLCVKEILSQPLVVWYDLIPDHPILFTNYNVA